QVESGPTCYSIRAASNISEELFVQLNPTTNCDALQVGQKLCVSEAERLFCYEHVPVSAGDSCWSIRTAHQLDEREFMEMNDGVECDKLAIGQNLCVRAGTDFEQANSTVAPTTAEPTPVFECPEAVTVRPGDTCHGIAVAFKITVDELKEANDDVECESL
ncbi:hypothetical protein PMAYCL1PPCAC_22627, partial [Pristionchus mayeri]